MNVLCCRVKVLFALVLEVATLFSECWQVFLLDLGVVCSQVVGEVRVEEVQTDDQCERRSKDADGESTVSGEDASSQSCDTDVEKTRSERFGFGDERLDLALNRALDGDPTVD